MKTEIKFDSFNFSDEILTALKKKKFEFASEIQAKAIPVILDSSLDVLGLAQTGTGKTAAFGLPLIEMIKPGNKIPKAIILTPTRELALQVCSELETYKGNKKLNLLTVYGGASISNQLKELKKGQDIIIGTPGRVLDLIKRDSLNLKDIEYFVLDEADEMLNMGFLGDIEDILKNSNSNRRVFLFSATMPDAILKLTKKYMNKHKVIEIEKKKFNSDLITQVYYKVKESDKLNALLRVIEIEDFFYGIIFCKTRNDVDEVTSFLKKNKYEVSAIHGEVIQSKREKILTRFREQKINILVATDVAARGIDVNNLSHVINFSIPQELKTYVHRIGRTGRAGNKGVAITFITPKQERIIPLLEKETNNSKFILKKLPSREEINKANDQKIVSEINSIITSGKNNTYTKLSSTLLQQYSPEEIISALLYKNLFKANIEFNDDSKMDFRKDYRKENQNRTRDKNNFSNSKRSKNDNFKNSFNSKPKKSFKIKNR